jgi:hypothetical protein
MQHGQDLTGINFTNIQVTSQYSGPCDRASRARLGSKASHYDPEIRS